METIRSLDIERVLEVAKTILLKLRSLASSDNATLKAGLAVLTLLFGPAWPILLTQRILGISETAPTGDRFAGTVSEHPPPVSDDFKFHSEALSKLYNRRYATATALSHLQRENIPPSASQASAANTRQDSLDLTTSRLLPKVTRPNSRQKPKARPSIPRSRTLNVFSNITNSLSRSSLVSFTRNDSRHPSTSTTATTSTRGTADSSTTESRFGMSISTSSIRAVSGNTSPAKIRTAQSSAYWTGRFVALHDKFRSEMLLPENLPMVICAQAEQAPPKATTASGLPAAATTGSIPPPHHPLKTSSSSGNDFAHHLETTAATASNERKHKKTASSSTTKSTITVTATTTAMTPRKSKPGTGTYGQDDHGDATLPLMMHDEHCRSQRVFQHLEALCATNEARRSLHAWQQTYARRVDCEALLPCGGSIEDHRGGGGGWVGRLLGGGGVGIGVTGKRNSTSSVAVGGVGGGPRGHGGKRGSFVL
ncbi:hypothetical protein DL765_011308 [Monosporascus sp. GIB2]|nr:hypothetical protein DL765_011308 [Monosporascus sp. GIB2]